MGGMFLFFKVGEQCQFLPPPQDFPRCSAYLPEISNIDDYERCNCGCGRLKKDCNGCMQPHACMAN